MSYKRKSTSDVLIAGRNIEMTVPYDVQTCIDKLESLQQDGWFARERIKISTHGSYGKTVTFHIERSISQGKSRNTMSINGALQANDDGTTEVYGEVEKQDMKIAFGLLLVIVVFGAWFILVPSSAGMGGIVMIMAMIFIPIYLVSSHYQEKSNTAYMLDLVRNTLR